MQHQDFERDGDFYHHYDQQKVHPQSRRISPQSIDPQELIKWLYVVAGILAFVFIVGMVISGGEVNGGIAITLIVVMGLAFFTTIMLLIFRGVQLTSTSYSLIRKKMQSLQTKRS